MNKPRIIEGRWWIHGDDRPPQFGILSFDPEGGFELRVKVVQSRADDQLLASVAANSKQGISNVIRGKDENDRPFTLFGCGLKTISTGAGLDSYQIQCQAAITNHSGSSWDEAQFLAAGVKYSLLTAWMNRRLLKQETDTSGKETSEEIKNRYLSYKVQLYDVLENELNSDVQVKIQASSLPSYSSNELNIRLEHTLYFIFTKPHSARSIVDDYVTVFLRLLSLLTGDRVFIQEFSVFDGDPFKPRDWPFRHSEVLLLNSGLGDSKNDTPAGFMIANYGEIESQFNGILKRWFACHARLKPAMDLHFAVLSNWVLTDQTRFLLLAQALEVYHARSAMFTSNEKPETEHQQRVEVILSSVPAQYKNWLTYKLKFSNQKSLGQRIKEILEQHKERAVQVTAKIPDFADKVRDSRNYYTHYSEITLRDGKVAKGLEIRRIVYALVDLLEICFLKELGIEGKPIERVVERNARMKWEDLKSTD